MIDFRRAIGLIFTLFLLGFTSLAQEKYPQNYFASPLRIPLYTSGTFGELRGNHFHSGLDIKTQGKIGQSVRAAAEGTIVRIKVSPYGFGRALYLRHPNGYTTVYAHLNKFNPELEAYVISEMKRKQRNEVDLFPPAGKFSYQKGAEIAKSGNSGGSGGPHLHFEIRNTKSEKIINPLLFGFKIEDSRSPEIGPLQVYFFREGQTTGQKEYSLVQESKGQYSVSGTGKVEGYGDMSFGLYAIDKQDKSNNRNGVYELKLFVAKGLEHVFRMETFAFAETRYINAHIDYGLKACCRRSSHRLYREPGNKLSTYPVRAGAGHLSFSKDTVVDVRIEASDAAGNVSVLNFKLHYKANRVAGLQAAANLNPSLKTLHYGQPEVLQGADYELGFKTGSFYRDYQIEVQQKPKAGLYSDLFSFGTRAIPVHRYYDLKLRINKLPKGVDPSKLFIASYRDGKYDDYEGGYYQNGWLTTRTRQLGEFGIALDTIAPSIKASNFSAKQKLKAGVLILGVKDDFSGIEEYNAWVDGLWVPVYFDAKTRRLLIDRKYWPKAKGSKQVLKLRVEDGRKNQREEIWELFVS